MNEEDRKLIEEMREEIREVSRKLDRLMAHFGLYSITIYPESLPEPPIGAWELVHHPPLTPYEFPSTTGVYP